VTTPAERILVELNRALEERRELVRSGEIEKRRAAARAAREAAERGLLAQRDRGS